MDDFLLNSSPPNSPSANFQDLPPSPPSDNGQADPTAPTADASAGTASPEGSHSQAGQPPAMGQPATGQDFRQFAQVLAVQHRLTAPQRDALMGLAELTTINQAFLWVGGLLLEIKDLVERVQPQEADFKLSERLTSLIDQECVNAFFDPTLSAYKDWPNKKVLATVKRDHLSAPLKKDAAAHKAVKARIGDKFIHFRNDSKEEIGKSLGTFDNATKEFVGPSVGIYELTENIIKRVCGRDCTYAITLPLIVRVAFIRRVFTGELQKMQNGKVAGNFWDIVDEQLKKIRESKDNDETRISKVFSRVLTEDRKKYGDADDRCDVLASSGHAVSA